VIQDPEGYEKIGQSSTFTDQQHDFVLELIDHDPTLYLDEIQLQMFHETRILACHETI
ncbi:hypothetical protein CROQUDRAFT_16451, partial [Cronartium quercuum f. sp. fusiforme G11]